MHLQHASQTAHWPTWKNARLLALRIVIAIVISLISGICCAFYQVAFNRQSGDVIYALDMARDLRGGVNPYRLPVAVRPVSYPVTAAIIVSPLIDLPPAVASGCFIGLSSLLLAFGLTRNGNWWALAVFLAFPYWYAVITVQWAPLILGVAFTPVLLPLALGKAQLGLPVIATNLTWRRVLACAILIGISFLLMPTWPLQWLQHQSADPKYAGQYLPPLLTLPFGPLLLIGLFWWRKAGVPYLLLLVAMPQRLWYDLLMIFAVPLSRRQILALVALSWVVPLLTDLLGLPGMTTSIALIYVPTLAMLVLTKPVSRP